MHRQAWLRIAKVALLVLVVQTVLTGLAGAPPARAEAPAAGSAAAAQSEPQKAESHAAGHGGAAHSDPYARILLAVATIVLAAMVGRWVAGRFGQPPVLGELLMGVLIGNLGYWLGLPTFVLTMHLDMTAPLFEEVWRTGASVGELIRRHVESGEMSAAVADQIVHAVTGPAAPVFVHMVMTLQLLSQIGVLLLLFMVGLESSVEEMVRVGPRALAVACLGVAAPFLLGYGAGAVLLPQYSGAAHLFLAATLCATSVGITARVFRDLNCLHTREARVILGAAVIDDVLGLILLAVVVGIAVSGRVALGEVGRILLLSAVFFAVVMLAGERLVRLKVRLFRWLDRQQYQLLLPLALAFLLAWLASRIGLASIVGAFAAGLIITERDFRDEEGHGSPEKLIGPLEKLFAPIFFVLVGMQVNLQAFLTPTALLLGLAFTIAAIAGKLVAGWPAGRNVDRMTVGIGMVPRGEVGLIFASIGKNLHVVSDAVFSAIVLMVVVTTLVTPVALKWSLARREARVPAAAAV